MKNIGVFFGSRTTEHDISVITAQLIISGLKGLNYNVTPIYINTSGEWLIDDIFSDIKTFTDPKKDSRHNPKYKKYYLDLEQSNGKMVFRKKGISGKDIEIDLAFPAFHGPYGEDGTMQGLFDMFDIPYVGCGVAASAIAMDKALTKQFFESNNIPTTKFVVFDKNEWEKDKKTVLEEVENKLKFPVFVKPVHLGSSIGISRVGKPNDLAEKIEVAAYYDEKILVEEGVENLMDATCCLIGNEEIITSEIQESVFSSELFDFEEKYLAGGGAQFGKGENGLIIPARLDKKATIEIKKIAEKVYKTLGCSGIARVDFLVDKKSGKYFANEINPLPGTLYHHLWKASGIELPELLEKLICFAEENHKKKKEIHRSFGSSVLSTLNSSKIGSKGIKV